MNTNSTYSLSLQRQFKNKGLDSDINQALSELKFGSMLRRSNIMKQKGYGTQAFKSQFKYLSGFSSGKYDGRWNTSILSEFF